MRTEEDSAQCTCSILNTVRGWTYVSTCALVSRPLCVVSQQVPLPALVTTVPLQAAECDRSAAGGAQCRPSLLPYSSPKRCGGVAERKTLCCNNVGLTIHSLQRWSIFVWLRRFASFDSKTFLIHIALFCPLPNYNQKWPDLIDRSISGRRNSEVTRCSSNS